MATLYGVLPLLHLSTINVEGEFDIVTTYNVLIDENLQDIIIENILNIMRIKGYYGVIISAQYINEQNQYLFYNYARKFSGKLDQEGFVNMLLDLKLDSIVAIALASVSPIIIGIILFSVFSFNIRK